MATSVGESQHVTTSDGVTLHCLNPLSDQKKIDSWSKNGTPWTTAIREGQIESRKLVTDHAVIDAVRGRSPKTVFDIGCGEGWLARELTVEGVDVYGVDVVPALVDQARVTGGGRFDVLSYEGITFGKVTAKFGVSVCNLPSSEMRLSRTYLERCLLYSIPAARSSCKRSTQSLGVETNPIRMGREKDPGPDSIAASKIRPRGIFASWRYGSNCIATVASNLWRYENLFIRLPGNQPQSYLLVS
jgi:SAM-dependent methyltransferase